MILNLYCIRDRATDSYGNPMFLVAHGQAIRSFTDEVNRQDKDNQLFQHPEDFDLYHLGTYDTSSGLFNSKPPEMISIGKSVAIR